MKEKVQKIVKKITLERTVKLIILLVFIIIGVFIIWSSIIVPYRNRKDTVGCLSKVYEDLKKEWQEGCRIEGKEIGSDGLCPLSPEKASTLYERYNTRKNECL